MAYVLLLWALLPKYSFYTVVYTCLFMSHKDFKEKEYREPGEGLPIKGRYYYVTGDKRIVYEDGEEVVYEYDSEEESWFEVI